MLPTWVQADKGTSNLSLINHSPNLIKEKKALGMELSFMMMSKTSLLQQWGELTITPINTLMSTSSLRTKCRSHLTLNRRKSTSKTKGEWSLKITNIKNLRNLSKPSKLNKLSKPSKLPHKYQALTIGSRKSLFKRLNRSRNSNRSNSRNLSINLIEPKSLKQRFQRWMLSLLVMKMTRINHFRLTLKGIGNHSCTKTSKLTLWERQRPLKLSRKTQAENRSNQPPAT